METKKVKPSWLSFVTIIYWVCWYLEDKRCLTVLGNKPSGLRVMWLYNIQKYAFYWDLIISPSTPSRNPIKWPLSFFKSATKATLSPTSRKQWLLQLIPLTSHSDLMTTSLRCFEMDSYGIYSLHLVVIFWKSILRKIWASESISIFRNSKNRFHSSNASIGLQKDSM